VKGQKASGSETERSQILRSIPFADPRLCAAIVNHRTFNGTIIETGIDS